MGFRGLGFRVLERVCCEECLKWSLSLQPKGMFQETYMICSLQAAATVSSEGGGVAVIQIHDKESQCTASRGWFRVARTLAPLAVDHSNAKTAEN